MAPKTLYSSDGSFPSLANPLSVASHLIKLPTMGFELTSMAYDTTRKLSHLNKVRQGSIISDNRIEGYTPPPYTMDYSLYCFSNKTTDWSQVVEQIIPHFNPTFNIPV